MTKYLLIPLIAVAGGTKVEAARPVSLNQQCQEAFLSPSRDWKQIVATCQAVIDAPASQTYPDSIALTAIGIAFVDGLGGLSADTAQGLKLLERAEGLGAYRAMDKLGQIYAEGRIVTRDDARALKYFRAALSRNSPDAIESIAAAYDQGLAIKPEPLEAARLYGIASSRGSTTAATWLSGHAQITPEQLAQNRFKLADVPPGLYSYEQKYWAGTEGWKIRSIEYRGVNFSALAYPDRALENEVEARLTLDCHVAADGDIDNCIIMENSKPDIYGFSPASIRAAQARTNFTHRDQWIAAYAGKAFTQIINWSLTPPAPPPQSPRGHGCAR
jgi:TPR repeat protein